jgi:hypothetical protein
MSTQPTPTVTNADVERIVRRDFPAARVEEVLAMLEEYGGEEWHREAPRVRLAVLKLAEGRMDRLRYEIEGAKCDYRDVLKRCRKWRRSKTESARLLKPMPMRCWWRS